MSGSRKIILMVRFTFVIWSFMAIVGTAASAATLTSRFLSGDPNAILVVNGQPYDMNDPAWLNNYNQNKNVFAYKLFAGFLMLGYQTEMGYDHGLGDQHLRVLHAFQARYGLPVSNLVTSDCLAQMDQLLNQREQALAPIAQAFPLYDHMQPLHPNDISQDALATIYSLPMSVLPQYLQMSLYELVQCIGGQCVGFIQDANGNNLDSWPTPIDLASDYRFVGAYFDPLKNNSRLPSAAVHTDTVLHEYAHYLDGFLFKNKDPLQPKLGLIDTTGFYAISYDLDSGTYCYTLKSSDPKDWITKYAAQFNGYGNCGAGKSVVFEDWAESFSMYVAAGKDFRAAAGQSAMVAQRYEWLKTNVFSGLEYDTDLPRGLESGCNDVYGTASAQPGYAHCNDNYIWDFTLQLDQNSFDTIPDQFTFTPLTDADPTALVESAPVIIKGINRPASISISGGEYSINGGGFVSTAGVVNYNDAVTVRLISSAFFNTSATATLTIGGIDGTFSVTTRTNIPPTISGSPATSGVVGTPYSFTPTAANASSFSVTGNIPPGLNFNTTTGALSGTPTTPGDYDNIVITATNRAGSASLPAFSISVKPPLPTIWAFPVTSGTVGTPYGGFYIWSTNATSFTVSGAIPPGLILDTSTCPGTLDGTPTTPGVYDNIIITATNGTGSTSLPAFSITVKLPLPSISGDPATAAILGRPYATFTPSVAYAASFSISGAVPPGLNFDTTNGSLSGTPSAAGTYGNIVIAVANSEGSAPLPGFAITVFPDAGSFTAGGSMITARQYHTATLLGNGKVLVTGGNGATGVLAGAELYDPATGSWSTAGSMADARTGHTATLLPNGSVLVAGGYNNDFYVLSGAELYDPATNSWSAAAAMSSTRAGHTASLLPAGKVLVTGGYDEDFDLLASAEIYDPASDSWSPVTPMSEARSDFTATQLANGKVLVTGGSGDNSAELYDPPSNSWSVAGSMLAPRFSHTATPLSDGKVLVTGGYDSGYLASAELYDPSSNSWSAAGSMAAGRQSHSSTLLADGTVLVAGGYDFNNGYLAIAEIYDPDTDRWITAGSMATPRLNHSATLLAGGKVLVAGGFDGTSAVASAELYSPDTTPDLFVFASRTGMNLTTIVESDPVVISGIDGPAAVSISSGEYAISADSGLTWRGWSNTAGTVKLNERIKVRQTSSSKVRTMTAIILTIGGIDGSFEVTTADLPGAPIITSVTGGNAQATVTFSAPASTGGSGITGYTVTSNTPGGLDTNAETTATTHTITGLANGTAYTFTVTAANAIGTGAASDPSNSVTPTDPFTVAPKAMIGATGYASLNAAYSSAASGAVIYLLGTDLAESLIMDKGKDIMLAGGYSADYSARTGTPTTLKGVLIISTGHLSVDGLVVK